MTVQVFYIPKVQKVTAKLKGSNEISDSEVKSSFYFNSKLHSKHVDVSLLIGYDNPKNDTASILLCRFPEIVPNTNDIWERGIENMSDDGEVSSSDGELMSD